MLRFLCLFLNRSEATEFAFTKFTRWSADLKVIHHQEREVLVKDFRAAVDESDSLRPVSRTVSGYAHRTMYTYLHDNWTDIKCW